MEMALEMWQVVLGAIPLVGGGVVWLMRLESRIRTLEVRQDNDEKNFSEMKGDIKDIKELLMKLHLDMVKMERSKDDNIQRHER